VCLVLKMYEFTGRIEELLLAGSGPSLWQEPLPLKDLQQSAGWSQVRCQESELAVGLSNSKSNDYRLLPRLYLTS